MRIEVDQSGAIGDTRVPTVLALSNEEHFSILIPAVVKRECLRELRSRGLKGTGLYLRLFATAVYLLLKDHLARDTEVIVDVEFEGQEAAIKQHLLASLTRGGSKVERRAISFERIGKRSPAHALALGTYRADLEAGREISTADILREFAA